MEGSLSVSPQLVKRDRLWYALFQCGMFRAALGRPKQPSHVPGRLVEIMG